MRRSNLFLNIYSKWADRPVTRVNVKHLEYDLIRNEPNSIITVITPYPSRYYAKVEFAHRGKPTTIKKLVLVINGKLSLDVAGFSPIRLENGDYCEEPVSFPVEERLAIEEGNFEIRAVNAFNKVFTRNTNFYTLYIINQTMGIIRHRDIS